MKFTKNELIMISRHAAGRRDETLAELDRALSVSADALDKGFHVQRFGKAETDSGAGMQQVYFRCKVGDGGA